MSFYLGLDNGGTTTKAALFDRQGREIGVASVSTAVHAAQPGFAERDMEEMWRANCTVIRRVLEETGTDPADVRAVAVCGHGKGLYLWGQDDKPLRPGILSTDNRAYAYPAAWRADGTEAKVFALSCQHIMACQPVTLLAWLRDHEPEQYRRIRWVFSCKDYVRFRLTGQARAELTDYSGSNLLNLHTKDYDPALLALFGLEDILPALPPLCRATEVCGTITPEAAAACGLRPGTPVAGGMFDIDACALAVGVTDQSHLCMIAGTWSINEYLRPTPVTDGTVEMNSLFCLPEYYLIEESSPTSAGNSEWVLREVLNERLAADARPGESRYDTANRWVDEVGPRAFVPVFLPFLMASNVHPNARASFVGLSASHTAKHLLRSVYEGIVFCHRWHADKLLASRPTPPDCIRLAGGAARSAVWAQMFADVLQIPVETVSANETGALGCAIAAAVAAGDYPDLASAAGSMCQVSGRYEPNENLKDCYEKKYALYCKTIACLDGLWDQMQALIEEGAEG